MEGAKTIKVYIMGKEHEVPEGLTIMKAIEYAGYRIVRGAGCRAGFCGACATVYRKANDYKLRVALACQTLAEDGMYLTEIPFVPATKAVYEIEKLTPKANLILQYYPEVARCVACNTCTKSCPQELKVMDYIQAMKRGDIAKAAELSFDCVQCGLCAARCPAEIVHYHAAQLARRVYGKYLAKPSPNLEKRIREIEEGKYAEEIKKLKSMPLEELKKRYMEQQKNAEKEE
ncbi:MAG: 4Fe-4S dicluster domain-containing protein [Thermoplasmata archaeon]